MRREEGRRSILLIAAVSMIAVMLAFGMASCQVNKEESKAPPKKEIDVLNLSTPESATEAFLEALKSDDEETLRKVYAGKIDKIYTRKVFDALSDEGISLSGSQEKTVEKMRKKILGFDYEIKDVKTEGKMSEVTVRIKTYDFKKLIASALKAKVTEVADMAYKAASAGGDVSLIKQDGAEFVVKLMKEMLKHMGKKKKKANVILDLEQNDKGEWIVQQLPKKFGKAVLGGMNVRDFDYRKLVG